MLTRRHFITFVALGGLAARVARRILGTPAARPAMFWKKKTGKQEPTRKKRP